MICKGRAWKFGKDINTDAILPTKYMNLRDPNELAEHCMENENPQFAKEAKEGDIIAGGTGGNANPLEGSPGRSTLFYTIYLFSTAFFDLRMGYASALAWVLFVVVASLTALATRFARGRIHYAD